MCSDPKEFKGYKQACRECNDCVNTYKNTWVVRCMAEKETLTHAYAVTLTYADVDGIPPLGARVFRYKDLQDFYKRIRRRGALKWGEIEMRYIVVGEKGSKNGRCHYHGVIFSSHPIHELGDLSSPYGEGITYSSKQRKVRHDWSIWGHGFVDFQRPDRQGMAYILKYILKGRMTAARSKGFAREGKTEWLASSTLWVSNGRSIGENWLFKTVGEMIENGRMPSSLLFRVPSGGEWYIGGPLRYKLACHLHGIADQRTKAGLPPLAGWVTLLKTVGKDITLTSGAKVKSKTYEVLLNGEKTQNERDIWEENDRREADEKSRKHWAAFRSETSDGPPDPVLKEFDGCFGIRACAPCEAARGYQDIYEDTDVEKIWRGAYEYEKAQYYGDFPPFSDWISRQGLVAFGCIKCRQNENRVRHYAEKREREYRASLCGKARR